jgi:hypothetical protein
MESRVAGTDPHGRDKLELPCSIVLQDGERDTCALGWTSIK